MSSHRFLSKILTLSSKQIKLVDLIVPIGILMLILPIIWQTKIQLDESNDFVQEKALLQQQDMFRIKELLQAIETSLKASYLKPSITLIKDIQTNIKIANFRLKQARTNYSFNQKVGIAKFHSPIFYALQDVEKILKEATQENIADSNNFKLLLYSAYIRIHDANRGAQNDLNDASKAFEKLTDQQINKSSLFKKTLIIYVSIFSLMTIILWVGYFKLRILKNKEVKSRKRLEDTIKNLNQGFALFDKKEKLVVCNEKYKKMYPPEQRNKLLGKRFSELWHTFKPSVACESKHQAVAKKSKISSEQRDSTDDKIPVEPYEITDRYGRVILIDNQLEKSGNRVIIFTDITPQKQAEKRLRHIASHDNLTGLPNRSYFIERLRSAIADSRRLNTKLAVIFFDLDNFKKVNDIYGHSGGDELLKGVAHRLRECIRENDTIARLGGDEFIGLFEHISTWKEVSTSVSRIIESLKSGVSIRNTRQIITTSIGISIFPDDGNNIDTLLTNADIACYHAKNMGRNNYQFFTEDLNKASDKQRQIENHLNHALNRDEFSLVYQPQLNFKTGYFSDTEALIRWKSPNLGELSAKDFIPFAESSGQMNALSRWTLLTACRELNSLNAQVKTAIKLTINTSLHELETENISQKIKDIIRLSKFSPSNIVIELNESIYPSDSLRAAKALQELSELGLSVSLDNFGRGSVSLKALEVSYITRIKISPSLTDEIENNPQQLRTVKAIIALAHTYSIQVIATGVERESQLRQLERLGCDGAQGHYIAPPLSFEALEQLYQTTAQQA
ncbi:MAG TPA: hypothetical protein DCZ12_00545 [Gammaproteobacteria bacterium]|nr:hypothetical protein [Gammaproteobacteria bacterium]